MPFLPSCVLCLDVSPGCGVLVRSICFRAKRQGQLCLLSPPFLSSASLPCPTICSPVQLPCSVLDQLGTDTRFYRQHCPTTPFHIVFELVCLCSFFGASRSQLSHNLETAGVLSMSSMPDFQRSVSLFCSSIAGHQTYPFTSPLSEPMSILDYLALTPYR